MDTSNVALKQNAWKDEYLRMIGSPNVSELKIEAAQALKIANLPQHLYKYRTFDVYSLNNLENDTVWLNIPADYNDPFEAVEYLNHERVLKALNIKLKDEIISQLTAQFAVPEEIIRRAQNSDEPANIIGEHLFKEHNVAGDDKIRTIFIALDKNLKSIAIEKHMEKIEKIQNTMKVCSFCESPKQLLMWSHYANCHKGFCVEYDLNLWKPDDVKKRVLYPVVYQNYFFDSTDHMISQIESGRFNNLYPLISCATKSKEWEYEQEWRFIFNIGDSFEKQNYSMNCQSKVFIGHKMDDDNKMKILKVCKLKDLEVYLSKPSQDKYQVEFDLINQ